MKTICAFLLSLTLGAGILGAAKAQTITDDAPIRTAPAEAISAPAPLAYEEPTTIDPNAYGTGPWLTPKEEHPCAGSMSLGFGQGDVLPYYGIDVADGKPVSHGDVSYGCRLTAHDRFAVELGATAPLATTHGDLGQERWFTVGFDHRMQFGPGKIMFGVSTSYRSINRFQSMADDNARLSAHVSYAFAWGRLTMAPNIEWIRDVPMKKTNILNWTELALPVSFSLADGGSIYFAPRFVHNVNSFTAVLHKNTWYGALGHITPPWHHLTLDTGISFAQYREHDSAFDLYAAADGDGKIWQVPKVGGARSGGPVVGLFATVSHPL
jgi:hypothetical protein